MPYTLRLFVFICFASSILGCTSWKGKREVELGQNIELVNWQQQQPNCSQQSVTQNTCPTFKFTGISFKNEPLLNNLIEQKLLNLVNARDASLWEYQQTYLAKANHGDHIYFNVKILEQTPTLTVLQLASEEQHTTQIYSPPRIAFINFDKLTKQDLQLADIIQGDKILAFWSNAQLVYKQWLELNQLLNNETYQQDWPFIKTQHVAILSHGIMLKYDANTLAPYALGMPTLVIPYNKLEGILKPHYQNY